MTKEELAALENRWHEFYRRRRKLQKELEVVNAEMRRIEEEIKNG